MQCEMCGSSEKLYKADVEGSVLTVCRACAACGKMIGPARSDRRVSSKKARKEAAKNEERKAEAKRQRETIMIISDDYSSKIRVAREKKGMKQEQLAKALALKECRQDCPGTRALHSIFGQKTSRQGPLPNARAR